MISSVESKRVEVAAACRRHGVERLDLFGSTAGVSFDPDSSDLDFIVSFERREPPGLFSRYFGLKEDLEALFERNVDLVMEGALRKDPSFAAGVRESLVSTTGGTVILLRRDLRKFFSRPSPMGTRPHIAAGYPMKTRLA